MTVIDATDANFEELLSQHPKAVVKYYADWCGHCRLLAPYYAWLAAQPQFQGLTFLRVNAETNPLARHRGRVNNLPFFAAFQQGQLLNFLSTTHKQNIDELAESLAAVTLPA